MSECVSARLPGAHPGTHSSARPADTPGPGSGDGQPLPGGAFPAGTHLGLRGFRPGGQLTSGKGKTSRKQKKKNIPLNAKPGGGRNGEKEEKRIITFLVVLVLMIVVRACSSELNTPSSASWAAELGSC